MHATDSVTTTPTRRTAMRFTLAALTAGLTVPALASTPNPDAELIRLCNRLVDLETTVLRLHETVEDDDERDALLDPLEAERRKLIPIVEDIDNPKTIEGASAMARVALAYMPLDLNGEREIGSNPEDWFFVCVAEFLTGDVA